MKYSTDLSNVVEGDLVAIAKSIFSQDWQLTKVVRTTKTQIIIKNFLGNEQKFARNGMEIGGTNYKYVIVLPTQQLIDEINFKELRKKVYDKIVNKNLLNKLTFEQLQDIDNLL